MDRKKKYKFAATFLNRYITLDGEALEKIEQDYQLDYLLYCAVTNSCYNLVTYFMEKTEFNTSLLFFGCPLIHHAILKPDLEMVKLLIKYGADINWDNGFQMSYYCSLKKCNNMFYFLLKRGYKIDKYLFNVVGCLSETIDLYRLDYIFIHGAKISSCELMGCEYGKCFYERFCNKYGDENHQLINIYKDRLMHWIRLHRKRQVRRILQIQRWAKKIILKPKSPIVVQKLSKYSQLSSKEE